MLNRSQIYTLLMLRNHALKYSNDIAYSMFSQLPIDVIREISEFGQNPGSDFDQAFKYVARGELSAAEIILDQASKEQDEDKQKLKELLRSSGTATTRCGLIVKHKTLLECALGEGDPEMVGMIKSYFSKFEGGQGEMEKQIERYRPCIEALQNQKPDDLTWLIDIIKKSSAKDVAAELAEGDKYDMSYQSELRTALNKFRDTKLDPKGRVITKPRMHCNYQNLRHAYAVLYSRWSELRERTDVKNEYNYDKCDLVAQQVIGFIQLVELPSRERYLFARGQVPAETGGEKIVVERSVNYKHGPGSFPDFDASHIKSHTGFGVSSFSSIFGAGWGRTLGWHGAVGEGWRRAGCRGGLRSFSKLMLSKNFKLTELMHRHPKLKTSGCVIA
jgi:hypothetical protein